MVRVNGGKQAVEHLAAKAGRWGLAGGKRSLLPEVAGVNRGRPPALLKMMILISLAKGRRVGVFLKAVLGGHLKYIHPGGAVFSSLILAETCDRAIAGCLLHDGQLRALADLARRERGRYEAGLMALREAGATTRAVTGLAKSVNSVIRSTPLASHGPEPQTVGQSLADAPSGQLIIPEPYRLLPNQTQRVIETRNGPITHIVAHAPILITARLVDRELGAESLRLEWRRLKKWQHLVMNRGIAFNAWELVKQASQGFPAASSNQAAITKYLYEFEAANLDALPCGLVSGRMGWQGEQGADGFLWGHTFIPADNRPAKAVLPDQTGPADWPRD